MTDYTDNTDNIENEILPAEENTENKPLNDSPDEETVIPETAPFQINRDMYGDAYRSYQKIFVFPKNRILQLILLVLAVDFGYHGAMDNSNTLAYLLMALCLALIAVLWYNPRRMRRSIMEVIREIEGDEYVFSMDSRKMTFRTVPPEYTQDVPAEDVYPSEPTELYYNKELRVIEKDEFFLICRGKQVFYVLPKYALYDNQAEIVRTILESNLGKRFRSKI